MGLTACALAAYTAAASNYPNIVFILVDDLGESGVPFNNPLITPTAHAAKQSPQGSGVAALREEGLLLTRHYVYKFCSPTRGSVLTGRYPFRLGSMRSNFIPWSRPDGLDLELDLLPQRLKALPAPTTGALTAAGGGGGGGAFDTHHVGK